jgi:hypothetical protein
MIDSNLPYELRGSALDSGQVRAELVDGVRYAIGSRDAREAVENRRARFITLAGEHLPIASDTRDFPHRSNGA